MAYKEIEKIKEDLEKCQKEREEYLNGWKREKADFINHKKEESERAKDLIDYSRKNFILKVLPILDDFEIALKEVSENQKEESGFIKGFFQIRSHFLEFLKKEKVEEMNCLGEQFDPNFHEAIDLVESDNEESGIVIEEIQKGYKIDGKLLRPAKVKVTK